MGLSPRAARTVRALAVALALLAGAAGLPAQAPPAAEPPLLVYDFHLGGTPAENIARVRSLGYSGLVTNVSNPSHLGRLEGYVRHARGLDDFRLLSYVVHDFDAPHAPGLWRQALPLLAGVDAPLWLIVRDAPSTDAVRGLLEQVARHAETAGVPAVIYPHWSTSIETADEAAALIAQVGHPNLRNSIHTCHEIRGGLVDALPAVAWAHAAGSSLVAIAGADRDAYTGPPSPFVSWEDAIKPLDRGDVDLAPFLQALRDAGYEGPVVLQTFGITNDPGHLRRSRSTYSDLVAALE